MLKIQICRKDHLIMNYTHKIDRLPIAEQEEVNQVLAPLFPSSSVVIVVVFILKFLLLLLLSYASQVARLFCNLFETGSASEWLLYISEWDAPGGGIPLSNIRVTTKVAF